MIGKLNRFARRMIRRNPDKYQVVVRSESMVEVLEKMLDRKLDHGSAADMGLLDSFSEMNKRLSNAPPAMQEAVRQIWFNGIKEIKASSSEQQKEEV